jgi:ectoine hydroxylase-related dioxygenase (phytanoyl-CoA dioxygenase family)
LVEQRIENPRVGGSIPPLATTSHIERDGFAVIDGVFDADEMDRLSLALDLESLPRSRAGVRHAMQLPTVDVLARSARLLRIARDVLGPVAIPFRATLFDKSPTSNWLVTWHQDTALPLCEKKELLGWGPWSVKAGIHYAHAPAVALDRVLALRIHLDDSTQANGPLRVIPGSHRYGVLSDDQAQRLAQETQPVACVVARGGVLAMRPLLIHASSKSCDDARRRVLHIEYAESMGAGDGLELALA